MSIWNKILVGFVFILAAVFLYMAARTLKTHEHWRSKAQQFEEKLATAEVENEELQFADHELANTNDEITWGIKRLRLELHKLLIGRGRVWTNCQPGQVNSENGQVAVTTDLPDPHGIANSTVLYVFEEANTEEGGQYLGEFKVTAVAEKQIQLEPTMKPTAAQLKRLAKSRGPWSLYEVMPADDHDIFTKFDDDGKLVPMDEADLKALFPEATVEQYVKDGQPATWEKIDEWGIDGYLADAGGKPLLDENGERVEGSEGVYHRKLRDYEVLFKHYHTRHVVLTDLIESTKRDKQFVDAALADAQQQVAFREQQVNALKSELARVEGERSAVANHEAVLRSRLASIQSDVKKLLAHNQAVAGRIAEIQLKASEQIDARTRTVAQAAGSN